MQQHPADGRFQARSARPASSTRAERAGLHWSALKVSGSIPNPAVRAEAVNVLASPFTASARTAGLGIDPDTFERYVSRLVQLGYSTQGALTALKWSFGRMLLHRGNPDMTALTMADVCELRCAADSFADRLWVEPVREFYSRSRGKRPSTDPAETFRRSATARINGAHLLLLTIGQVDAAPPGRVDAGSWTSRLAPAGTPPKMTAVIERYLRLHLDANLGREQSVRHFRDALRRLVLWLREAHPEITSFDQLDRKHAEEFLRWLGEQTSEHTGMPLALDDPALDRHPAHPIRHRDRRLGLGRRARHGCCSPVATSRRLPGPVPRFIPDHELAELMSAIDQLPDQYQRAALIVARWCGARRDEIRRLADRLPRRLPRRASAAADPGRQGLRRTHHSAAPKPRPRCSR